MLTHKIFFLLIAYYKQTLKGFDLGTVFEFGEVFCFTDFLNEFLLRVRGSIGVKAGVVLG